MDRNHDILKKALILFAAGLALFVGPRLLKLRAASQANYYLAQNAAGAQDGSSCANAHGAADFNNAANWGNGTTQIGAGTTVHLCGIFTGTLGTTILTVQGSGSAGMPITIKWEPGAGLTSPACSTDAVNGGCFNIAGTKSYLVFDGNCFINGLSPGLSGTPCSVPSITNTDNGTAIALGGCCHNQNATGGFEVSSTCSNCEWKNLTITKNYVHTPNVGDHSQNPGACLATASGAGWSFHDNYCTDGQAGVLYAFGAGCGTDTGVAIYNNTFDQENHMIDSGQACGTGKMSGTAIYGNHFKSSANWDEITNNYHHDNIIIFPADCVNNTQTNTLVYNNLFDGDIGFNNTAYVFIGCGIRGLYVFNNILLNPTNRTLNNGEVNVGNDGAADNLITVINNYFDCGNSAGVRMGWSATNGTIANNAITNCSSYWNSVSWTNHSSPSPINSTGMLDYNALGADVLTGSKMSWDDDDGAYPFPGAMGSATYQGDFMCPPYSGFTGSLVGAGVPCQDGHSIVPAGGFNVNSNYVPLAGSPLIKAGFNFTSSLGATVPALLFDKAGNPRPATGNWEIGPFQFAALPNVGVMIVNKTPFTKKLVGTSFPIVMQVIDAGYNPIANTVITMAVKTGAGSITPATATTDANGQISATITLSPRPGLNTFTFTATGADYVLRVQGY